MNSQDISDMLSKPPGCPSQLLVPYTSVKEQRVFICFKLDLLSLSEDLSPQFRFSIGTKTESQGLSGCSTSEETFIYIIMFYVSITRE